MRSYPIPAAGSNESVNSQVPVVQASPSRKKESLADRVYRTRRSRTSNTYTAADGESQASEPSQQSEAASRNNVVEHRQDNVSSPRRKTIALAMAHRGKSSTSAVVTATVTNDTAKQDDISAAEQAIPKSPSLMEKRMRALARVNKSPRKKAAGSSRSSFFDVTSEAATTASAATTTTKKHAVVAVPDQSGPARARASPSPSFGARYGSAAAFSSSAAPPLEAKKVAAQPPKEKAEVAPVSRDSAISSATADRYRIKKSFSPPDEEEKKEDDVNVKWQKNAEIEGPIKVTTSVSSMKARYGGVQAHSVEGVKEQSEPVAKPEPILKRSAYRVATASPPPIQDAPPVQRHVGYRVSTASPPPTQEFALRKPDPPESPKHRRSSSQGNGIILPRHEPDAASIMRPAIQESRSYVTSTQESDFPKGLVSSRSMEFDRPQYRSSRNKQANKGYQARAYPARDAPEVLPVESKVVIETPDKVSVSNMKARFSSGSGGVNPQRAISAPRSRSAGHYLAPTASSQNKRLEPVHVASTSSWKTDGAPVPTSPPRRHLNRKVSPVPTDVPGDRQDASHMDEQRVVIETPDKVSVSDMKGMFNTQGTPSFYRTKTPCNTPSTPPSKVRPGSDVATPHGPTAPQRILHNSTTASPSPSWRNRSASPSPVVKESHSSWTKPTPPTRSASPLPPSTQSWRNRSPSPQPMMEQRNAPHVANEVPTPPLWKKPIYSAAVVEMNTAPKVEEPASVEVIDFPVSSPKSPRARTSSIPKWGKSTRPASPCSPSRRPSNLPSPTKRASPPPSKELHELVADLEIIDTAPIYQSPQPPPSPRNRDRPWMNDLQVMTPTSWQQRWGDDADGDYQHLREQALGAPSSQPKNTKLESFIDSRASTPPAHENHVSSNNGAAQSVSLTQMAAYSVHAVDYDQAVCGFARNSESIDDEESHHSAGTGGAIPHDLPPELAKLIASNDDVNEARSADVAALMKTKTSSKSETRKHAFNAIAELNAVLDEDATPDVGIVFGEPTTYGAAGGEVEITPPRVADRAKAIANWKGGLGVPPKRSSPVDIAIDTSNSDESDVVFGDPTTFGAAGGEDLQQSPRVAQRAIAIEDWNDEVASSPSKSPREKVEKPVIPPPVAATNLESKVPRSRPLDSNGSKEKGASAVLRFWASTSEDEVDGASAWADKDPSLVMNDVTPEDLEQHLLGAMGSNANTSGAGEHSVKSWHRQQTDKSPLKESKTTTTAPDPFSFDAVAALNLNHSGQSSEQKSKNSTAFDPFWDTEVPASPADFGGMSNFFDTSKPASNPKVFTKEETFSPPQFTPKATEEFATHQEVDRRATMASMADLNLNPPSRSLSEESDKVVNRKSFSDYSKLSSPSKSAKLKRMKQRGMMPIRNATPPLHKTSPDMEDDPWSYDADEEELNASGFSI